jgi:hypothetical protein
MAEKLSSILDLTLQEDEGQDMAHRVVRKEIVQ